MVFTGVREWAGLECALPMAPARPIGDRSWVRIEAPSPEHITGRAIRTPARGAGTLACAVLVAGSSTGMWFTRAA